MKVRLYKQRKVAALLTKVNDLFNNHNKNATFQLGGLLQAQTEMFLSEQKYHHDQGYNLETNFVVAEVAEPAP